MKAPAVIQLDHFYKQPPRSVWRALTEPALLARWWVPGDMRPVVGHRFELEMPKWGKQPCEVVAAEPERLLSFRFATETLNTTITFRLAAEGTGTRLTLIHEGFDLDSPLAKQAFEGMKSGWPHVLERMEDALSD